MSTNRTVSLSFGALAAPIHEQLTKQGYPRSAASCKGWEVQARALAMVRIHGLVPDAICRKGERRLLQRIVGTLSQDIPNE